jgi:hypothetical protein
MASNSVFGWYRFRDLLVDKEGKRIGQGTTIKFLCNFGVIYFRKCLY